MTVFWFFRKPFSLRAFFDLEIQFPQAEAYAACSPPIPATASNTSKTSCGLTGRGVYVHFRSFQTGNSRLFGGEIRESSCRPIPLQKI
jgi:hypothetical protein